MQMRVNFCRGNESMNPNCTETASQVFPVSLMSRWRISAGGFTVRVPEKSNMLHFARSWSEITPLGVHRSGRESHGFHFPSTYYL